MPTIDQNAAARLPQLAAELARARDFSGAIQKLAQWQLSDTVMLTGVVAYLTQMGGAQAGDLATLSSLSTTLANALQRLGSFPLLWPLETATYTAALNAVAPLTIGPSASQAWASGVVAAGGTVSDAFRARADAFAAQLVNAGLWPLYGDVWLTKGENLAQALVSFKRGKLGIAVNSPAWQAAGLKFDGVASYVDTTFIPRFDGAYVPMTQLNARLAVRETVDLNQNSYAAGCGSGAGQNINMRPRTSSTSMHGGANSQNSIWTLNTATSAAVLSISTSDGLSTRGRQDGVALVVQTPAAGTGTPVAVHSFFQGALNSIGTAGSFRSCTLGWMAVGVSLGDALAVSEASIVNAFLTAAGLLAELPVEEGPPQVMLLSAEQADAVRGPSAQTAAAALSPQPLTDGSFFLGLAVLDDPAHAEHHDVLVACPVVDYSTLASRLPAPPQE